MGAKFSADAEDAQILIRNKYGQLELHTGKMESKMKCTPMPIPLNNQKIAPNEQKVQYIFFPGSNYNGKNLHVHPFYDDDCDTPGNDVVSPERNVLGKKNVNHMKQGANSNSNFFEYNTDAINMPIYPKFSRKENGALMSRYTKRSAYNNCTLIPYPAVDDKNQPVDVKHNGVPLKMFTDKDCKNEYVNILAPPKSIQDHYNVDDRDTPIKDDDLTMKYTNIKSYVEPAVKTNSMYYRTFREQYP